MTSVNTTTHTTAHTTAQEITTTSQTTSSQSSASTVTLPTIFLGHGSPMIALEDSKLTHAMTNLGEKIRSKYGIPKAILMVSGHWYTPGTRVQSAQTPQQIYDMYGFPRELYQVKYPVKGYAPLTQEIQTTLGSAVTVDNSWGIDHGAWSVLVHLFPQADIPVVQLSVNANLSAQESFELGAKLSHLRSQGYLLVGSGNVVHNLMRVEWDNKGGTAATRAFDTAITAALTSGNVQEVIDYQNAPSASYAVPTPDHYLPLLYMAGAAQQDISRGLVQVFNEKYDLGSMAMTSFVFGM